jgi:regulator of protease activity HflC (stomatin/prohibitin superfamily)
MTRRAVAVTKDTRDLLEYCASTGGRERRMTAYRLDAASALPQTRWQRFAVRRLPNIVIGLMVATLVLILLYPYFVVTVPTGHVGVLWKRLNAFGIHCWCLLNGGTVLDPRELREEGLHIIWPWDRLYLYDLRLQTYTQTYNAISLDGAKVVASINVRFQLRHDSVAQLHKFIGPEYRDLVVLPEVGSVARKAIAQHRAEDVYSTYREAIENYIRELAETQLRHKLNTLVQPESSDQLQQIDTTRRLTSLVENPLPKNLSESVVILDTLVLGIALPEAVTTAINRKVEQFYVAQEYEYRILREEREATRRRIEAAGIRDFQQIVSQGMSDSYLRFRGIEATLQLAQSNNAKTVIIGSNKDGLPIILGNADAPGRPPSSESGALPSRTTVPPASSDTAPVPDLIPPSQNTPPIVAAPPSPAELPKPQSSLPSGPPDIGAAVPKTAGPADSSAQ